MDEPQPKSQPNPRRRPSAQLATESVIATYIHAISDRHRDEREAEKPARSDS